MPCAGVAGVEYVDNVVAQFYEGCYGALLKAFVEDEDNMWCPTWVRENYRVRNQRDDTVKEQENSVPTKQGPTFRFEEDGDATQATRKTQAAAMREDGEPPDNEEETNAATLDMWNAAERSKWQLHSERGPNIDAQGKNIPAKPWTPNVNPVDYDWQKQWQDIDVESLRTEFEARKQVELVYDKPGVKQG